MAEYLPTNPVLRAFLIPVPRSARLTGTHTPTSAAPVCWRWTAWVRMRPR